MTIAMIAKIESMLMDDRRAPDERSVWGFILFLVYTRFRAFDGARIPHEPKLEREDYNVHSILSFPPRPCQSAPRTGKEPVAGVQK